MGNWSTRLDVLYHNLLAENSGDCLDFVSCYQTSFISISTKVHNYRQPSRVEGQDLFHYQSTELEVHLRMLRKTGYQAPKFLFFPWTDLS